MFRFAHISTSFFPVLLSFFPFLYFFLHIITSIWEFFFLPKIYPRDLSLKRSFDVKCHQLLFVWFFFISFPERLKSVSVCDLGLWVGTPGTAIWCLIHRVDAVPGTFSWLGFQIAVNQGLPSTVLKSGCRSAQFGDVCAVTLFYCFHFSSFNDCMLKLSQIILYYILKLYICM